MLPHRKFCAGALRPWLAALACATALAGCGGGGSDAAAPSTPTPTAGPATDGEFTARMSATSLVVERDLLERRSTPTQTVSLLVFNPPADGYYYRLSNTSRAIQFVGKAPRSADFGLDLLISLPTPGGALPLGAYDDTVTLEVCADAGCARQVAGSPFNVAVRFTIGFFAPSHPTLRPLPLANSVTLPHDVVASAYSAELDALVSVSTRPSPALYVYDLTTGRSRSVALATAPTSLSIEPGGQRAAVGHDAALSVVQLQPAGPSTSASPEPVKRYPLTFPVGAVVFDGRGHVHAFSSMKNGFSPMFNLDLASGAVEQVNAASGAPGLFGSVRALLHPAGDRLYATDRDISPSDLYVSRLTGATAAPLVDSIYHGEYPMCGDLWVSPRGLRLYTACGNTFMSNADPALDMRYSGALTLAPEVDVSGTSRAVSISESPTGASLAILEQPANYCNPRLDQLSRCFTLLSRHVPATLASVDRLALAPVTVGTDRFSQVGRLVFHRSNGALMLLSELRSAPDATASIRLSSVP